MTKANKMSGIDIFVEDLIECINRTFLFPNEQNEELEELIREVRGQGGDEYNHSVLR